MIEALLEAAIQGLGSLLLQWAEQQENDAAHEALGASKIAAAEDAAGARAEKAYADIATQGSNPAVAAQRLHDGRF